MHKFLLGVLLVLAFSFGLFGCDSVVIDEIKSTGNWQIIKSPRTGICYEVFVAQRGYGGFMGMSEVDCNK